MNQINPIGTIYDNAQPTVIVHNGLRGPVGIKGDEGDTGPQGDSIQLSGQWQSGASYGPLDAVGWRSSGLNGVQSLYVQSSSYPASASTTEPQDDPARWVEIGITSSTGSFGGTWLVVQVGHGFTQIGQPVAFNGTSYVLADASNPALFAIGVVREVVATDKVILQSTGSIPNVAATLALSGVLTPGALYYVSAVAGRLTDTPPSGVGQFTQAIFIAGASDGIVLPWKPTDVQTTVLARTGEITKYYYTASAGQTVFSGPDDDANTLDLSGYADGDVFLNGLNLRVTAAYSFNVPGNSMTLVTPASLNDLIEIWITEEAPVGVSTRTKMDALTFDGVSTDYALLASAVPVPYTSTIQFEVFLDGHPQEPQVDFDIIDVAGDAVISFASAPEAITDSWIVLTG